MPLDDDARSLHARHLLLPEIGQAGQELLCAASARPARSAEPRAEATARDYLERAGVAWRDAPGAESCAVPDAATVERVAGRPDLEEAAAMLVGALAAVETIKSITGAGRVVALSSLPTLCGEPE